MSKTVVAKRSFWCRPAGTASDSIRVCIEKGQTVELNDDDPHVGGECSDVVGVPAAKAEKAKTDDEPTVPRRSRK